MLELLEGKKTYLLAGFFVVLVGGLVAAGQLTPELALDVLAFAAPCFAATFRAAIQANHARLLQVLEEVAQTGADLRLHKPDLLAVDAETLAKLAGPVLVSSLNGTPANQPPCAPASTGILSGGWPEKPSNAPMGGTR